MAQLNNYVKCQKCPLKLICKGGCPMCGVFEFGSIFQPSSYLCQIEKELLPKVLLLIKEQPDLAKIIFDKFELKIC